VAEKTGIAWCDSTWNPWIGCTKVSPGCDHCYAAEQDSRKRWDGGKTHWGAGVPRYRTSASNWVQPIAWNKKAAKSGEVHRVFCASLADVFDNEIDLTWRLDLWQLIEKTPNLSWLLVTKRIGNVPAMVPAWMHNGFPTNVRILITVVNQEEADRDVPKLLALSCKNGISYEPALGPVDWSPWLWPMCWHWDAKYRSPEDAIAAGAYAEQKPQGLVSAHRKFLEWIIVGGESGPKARPFDIDWAYSTVAQCKGASVPCFVKQLGVSAFFEPTEFHESIEGREYHFKDRAGADPAEWPEHLRVREFPK